MCERAVSLRLDNKNNTRADNAQVVNDVAFHPSGRVLASCSSDCTIRLFDIAGNQRRAHRVLNDGAPIYAIDFHPSGDFLLAATNQPIVRLFDVNANVCFRTRDEASQHATSVNGVCFARDGKQFATCSDDGSVKLWDGVALKCVATLAAAHRGAPVLTAQLSRSARYLLTAANDASFAVWDLATLRPLVVGAAPPLGGLVPGGSNAPPSTLGRAASPTAAHGACWSFDERLVFVPSFSALSARIYATRTGAQVGLLGGHNGAICTLAASPAENVLATGSFDCRARFWALLE